jgi:hypothetical protein
MLTRVFVSSSGFCKNLLLMNWRGRHLGKGTYRTQQRSVFILVISTRQRLATLWERCESRRRQRRHNKKGGNELKKRTQLRRSILPGYEWKGNTQPRDTDFQLYRLSNLTWNPPREHTATAATELPGNEFITTHAISFASWYVGLELRGTLSFSVV